MAQVSKEARELRAEVLAEREAKAAQFVPDPGVSTLVGRTYGPVLVKPLAIDAATGLPTTTTGSVTSAAAEPEPQTVQLDLKTHEPKPRGLKT